MQTTHQPTRSLGGSIDMAMYFLKGLDDHQQQIHAIASTLEQNLCPPEDGNDDHVNYTAWKLAEVVSGMAGDLKLLYNLQDILEGAEDHIRSNDVPATTPMPTSAPPPTSISTSTLVRLLVQNKAFPDGWEEDYLLSIRPDSVYAWAKRQVSRWNRDYPDEPRELGYVQVMTDDDWQPVPECLA